MKTLNSVKNVLVTSGLVLGSILSVSGAASASGWGYPRVGNPPLEAMCANPDLFDSMAVGQACSSYYSGGNWQGRGRRSDSYTNYDDSRYNSRPGFSADRFFDRVGE
jgi:F0F1-type ATP synthase membrane subunit c/vacuolar-type H+-ATPase subunit K